MGSLPRSKHRVGDPGLLHELPVREFRELQKEFRLVFQWRVQVPVLTSMLPSTPSPNDVGVSVEGMDGVPAVHGPRRKPDRWAYRFRCRVYKAAWLFSHVFAFGFVSRLTAFVSSVPGWT